MPLGGHAIGIFPVSLIRGVLRPVRRGRVRLRLPRLRESFVTLRGSGGSYRMLDERPLSGFQECKSQEKERRAECTSFIYWPSAPSHRAVRGASPRGTAKKAQGRRSVCACITQFVHRGLDDHVAGL